MSVALIVVVSGMAAYVLARSENKWLQVVYLLIVAGFAVPVTAVLVPLFQMVSAAGFLNNHLAIVLPYAAYGIPFTTILFYAFFLDFPRELEDAARLDGCNRLQIFFRVILPLSGPAVASAAIFQAVFIWNEFLLALLMLTRPEMKTLPVGILQLQGEFASDWPAVMAGLAIATLPILAVFVSRKSTSSGRWPASANRSAHAKPRDREHRQGLWRLPRHQGRELCRRTRRVHRHGRTLRLRQVHPLACHRRARGHLLRPRRASMAATSRATSRPIAASPWCSRTTRSIRT